MAGHESFIGSDAISPFWIPDQDSLNLAALCTPHQVAIMGPEAMGFIASCLVMMSHAIGEPKPWRINYLMALIYGAPPRRSQRSFWQYVDGPIKVFDERTLRMKRRVVKLAVALGRFYRDSEASRW